MLQWQLSEMRVHNRSLERDVINAFAFARLSVHCCVAYKNLTYEEVVMSHPLLKEVFYYKDNGDQKDPEGFYFDEVEGLWSNGRDYLVDLPERKVVPMATKKADRETGEDQKGR